MAPGLRLSPGQRRHIRIDETHRTDYLLLEVDEDVLQELLDGSLCFKGSPEEEVVLCGRSRTFAVKTVGTTNAVLAGRDRGEDGRENGDPNRVGDGGAAPAGGKAPETPGTFVIEATLGSHLELVPSAPRLAGARRLLEGAPYDGPEAGAGCEAGGEPGVTPSPASGPSSEELLAATQASPGELEDFLAASGAVAVRGRWRLPTPRLVSEVLEAAALGAVELGTEPDAADSAAAAAHVAAHLGVDRDLAERLLAPLVEEVAGGAPTLGAVAAPPGLLDGARPTLPRTISLAGRAARLHAIGGLLRERRTWGSDELALALRDALPGAQAREGSGEGPGSDPPPPLDPSLLAGIALVSDDGRTVEALLASDLPDGSAEARLEALFARRPLWRRDDLRPYVASLLAPGQSLEALLLRSSRAVQPDPQQSPRFGRRR